MVSDPVRVALIVAKALEAVRVRYVVGRSLASAVSGEPRSTLDVDLAVELSEKDVAPFIAALGDRFHVDSDALRRAVRERSSTNVIHYATSTKVGLFVAGGSRIDRQQMDRRKPSGWLEEEHPIHSTKKSGQGIHDKVFILTGCCVREY